MVVRFFVMYDLSSLDEGRRRRVLRLFRDFGGVRRQLSVWEFALPDDPRVVGKFIRRLRYFARVYRVRFRVVYLCERCYRSIIEIGLPMWSEEVGEEVL